MSEKKDWFNSWFNSPYYHILYKNRDTREAEFFLRNLVRNLGFTKHQAIVDLACGKGRHSVFLNQLGFNITGVDLAEQSISWAKQFENERLHFEVKDLRDLQYKNEFDVALNLFTSFGYFDCHETNLLVMKQIYQALKPNGIVVIDFMNVQCVLSNLVQAEQKVVDDIAFNISKIVKNNSIIKQIDFTTDGKSYSFTEQVQALTLNHFEDLFASAGFVVKQVFGNYALKPFNAA